MKHNEELDFIVAKLRNLRLIGMAERFEVEEIVVLTISHDFGARVRSYELVAEAIGLEARPL